MWCAISNWIEHHAGLAAWVQGIGSIGAILAAIWISNHDRWMKEAREKEDRWRQACGIAIAVLSDVEHLEMRSADLMVHGKAGHFELEEPEIIHCHLERLWILGPAGDVVVQLLRAVLSYNRLVKGVSIPGTLSQVDQHSWRDTVGGERISEVNDLSERALVLLFKMLPDKGRPSSQQTQTQPPQV